MEDHQKESDAVQKLLPLMFEMGRLMKVEIARDSGQTVPSHLHVETLRFIQQNGAPTMSDIAEYLKVTPPTATSLVNTFVKEGNIKRIKDPEDRRLVRLTLSDKGIQALEIAMHLREEAFRRVVANVSDADRTELARILALITRSGNSSGE